MTGFQTTELKESLKRTAYEQRQNVEKEIRNRFVFYSNSSQRNMMFFTVSRTQIKYIKLSNLKLKFIFLKQQTSRNMIIKYNAQSNSIKRQQSKFSSIFAPFCSSLHCSSSSHNFILLWYSITVLKLKLSMKFRINCWLLHWELYSLTFSLWN